MLPKLGHVVIIIIAACDAGKEKTMRQLIGSICTDRGENSQPSWTLRVSQEQHFRYGVSEDFIQQRTNI
jgi:hypothetical protein